MPRFTVIAALGAIFVASLTCSVLLTEASPERAFFVTHTRVWELALGGLLALGEGLWLVGRGSPARSIAGLVGLGAVVGAAVLFSPHTPFPGAAALVPTLGAALVIFAADPRTKSAHSILKSWPFQYVGDRSYSIYLWHWPLLVFAGVLLDRDLTWIDGLVLVVLTLVVAHISFSLVETPFWKGRFKTSAVSQPLGLGIACILACVLAAGTIFSVAKRPAALSIDAKNYPGPTALLAGVLVPRGVDPVPPLTWVEKDLPIVYQLGCHQNIEDSEALSCTLGDPTNKGGLHVVVAGDSHAAQWIPALQVLAQKNGWKLTTFTKSACPLTRALTYASCAEWREKVMDSIRAIHPDLVVTSQRRRGRTPKRDRLDVSVVDGLKDVWSDLVMQGIRVVAVRDTPILATNPPECLAMRRTNCATLRQDALKIDDPIVMAAEDMPAVWLVDLTPAICGDEYCEPVVGNILVWQDRHHLTATYAAALASQFALLAGLDEISDQKGPHDR